MRACVRACVCGGGGLRSWRGYKATRQLHLVFALSLLQDNTPHTYHQRMQLAAVQSPSKAACQVRQWYTAGLMQGALTWPALLSSLQVWG